MLEAHESDKSIFLDYDSHRKTTYLNKKDIMYEYTIRNLKLVWVGTVEGLKNSGWSIECSDFMYVDLYRRYVNKYKPYDGTGFSVSYLDSGEVMGFRLRRLKSS